MKKVNFPHLYYYDQDFITIYNKTWVLMEEYLKKGDAENGFASSFLSAKDTPYIEQVEAVFTALYSSYNNKNYPCTEQMDNFYNKQEKDGAICRRYSLKDGTPLYKNSADYLSLPIFAWGEYSVFYRNGERKRGIPYKTL